MPTESHLVEIWTVSLEAPRPIVLSPDEHARAARFQRESDRTHWARARTALRSIIASYLGCNPLDIAFRRGPHGKPYIGGGPEFNLSHSGNWCLVGVSQGVAVGVDIEHFRENVDIAKLLARLGETDLPESRTALYQRWTMREASSKATGAPLFRPPDPGIRTCPVRAPAGYAAAIATPEFEPEPVYREGV